MKRGVSLTWLAATLAMVATLSSNASARSHRFKSHYREIPLTATVQEVGPCRFHPIPGDGVNYRYGFELKEKVKYYSYLVQTTEVWTRELGWHPAAEVTLNGSSTVAEQIRSRKIETPFKSPNHVAALDACNHLRKNFQALLENQSHGNSAIGTTGSAENFQNSEPAPDFFRARSLLRTD